MKGYKSLELYPPRTSQSSPSSLILESMCQTRSYVLLVGFLTLVVSSEVQSQRPGDREVLGGTFVTRSFVKPQESPWTLIDDRRVEISLTRSIYRGRQVKKFKHSNKKLIMRLTPDCNCKWPVHSPSSCNTYKLYQETVLLNKTQGTLKTYRLTRQHLSLLEHILISLSFGLR